MTKHDDRNYQNDRSMLFHQLFLIFSFYFFNFLIYLLALTFREEALHGHLFFGLNTIVTNIFCSKIKLRSKHLLLVYSFKEYCTLEHRAFFVCSVKGIIVQYPWRGVQKHACSSNVQYPSHEDHLRTRDEFIFKHPERGVLHI